MNKEEILAASKRENKKKDYYEVEVELKGATMASLVMLVLAFIYFSYEIMKGKGTNYAFYSLITVYNFILYGYKAIKIEKSRKINIVNSIIWGLLTIILVLSYFEVI